MEPSPPDHQHEPLRIALELPLKRLLVGGYEKVFEIGRVFRNEGLGSRYNPEFTMLEAYEAFADYTDMMELTEQLVAQVVRAVSGGTIVHGTIDVTPPWPRMTVREAMHRYARVDVHGDEPAQALRADQAVRG